MKYNSLIFFKIVVEFRYISNIVFGIGIVYVLVILYLMEIIFDLFNIVFCFFLFVDLVIVF